MNKNRQVLGIGAIAILAAVLIASSNLSTLDVFAAKKYDRSDTQSAVTIDDCTPVTDVGNGFQPIDIFGHTDTNCIGDDVKNQDSDGAAIESNPSASSDNEQGEPAP